MLSYERLKAYSDNDFTKLREHLQMRRRVWTVVGTGIAFIAYISVMPFPKTPWGFWGSVLGFMVPALLVLAIGERLRTEFGPGPADDLLDRKKWRRAVLSLAQSSPGAREVLAYAQERGRHLYGLDLREMRRRRDEEEAVQLSKTAEALGTPDIAPGEPNPLSTDARPHYLEYAGKSDAQLEVLASADLKSFRWRASLWTVASLALAIALLLAINAGIGDRRPASPAEMWLEFAYLVTLGLTIGMTICAGALIYAGVGHDSQFDRILDPDTTLDEVKELLASSSGARAVRNAAARAGRKLYRFDLHEMQHQREHEELETLRNPGAVQSLRRIAGAPR